MRRSSHSLTHAPAVIPSSERKRPDPICSTTRARSICASRFVGKPILRTRIRLPERGFDPPDTVKPQEPWRGSRRSSGQTPSRRASDARSGSAAYLFPSGFLQPQRRYMALMGPSHTKGRSRGRPFAGESPPGPRQRHWSEAAPIDEIKETERVGSPIERSASRSHAFPGPRPIAHCRHETGPRALCSRPDNARGRGWAFVPDTPIVGFSRARSRQRYARMGDARAL